MIKQLVFFQIYLFILILPWTRLRERLALPSKFHWKLLKIGFCNSRDFNGLSDWLRDCYSTKKFLHIRWYSGVTGLGSIDWRGAFKLHPESGRVVRGRCHCCSLPYVLHAFGVPHVFVRILWVSRFTKDIIWFIKLYRFKLSNEKYND